VLVVDFRKNESYTFDGTPAGVYQEFFRWRMKPETILGFSGENLAFRWKNAADVEPEILAGHLLRQVEGRVTGSRNLWAR